MKRIPKSPISQSGLTCIEICSGAGGQAIGLERAGFEALEEVPRIEWNEMDRSHSRRARRGPPGGGIKSVSSGKRTFDFMEGDVRDFSAKEFKGVDLLAGGVPCPPFSKAGKQLGSNDERDLFPEALCLVDECRPKAVMLENLASQLAT